MHRADGRGLDRLDLQPDSPLDVLIAGRGGNPQNNGMKTSLEQLRAARSAAIYRLNEKTVFRTGYGLTYNAHAVGARGARRQRLSGHDRVELPQRRAVRATTARCSRAFRRSSGPTRARGRVPLDRAAAEYTPEIDNIDRGYVQTWNVAFERRLPFDTSVDVAYVGAKGAGGYAALDINAPTTLGGGDQGRPYFVARTPRRRSTPGAIG